MDRLVTDLLLADASALVELVRPKSHSKGVASAFCEAVAAVDGVHADSIRLELGSAGSIDLLLSIAAAHGRGDAKCARGCCGALANVSTHPANRQSLLLHLSTTGAMIALQSNHHLDPQVVALADAVLDIAGDEAFALCLRSAEQQGPFGLVAMLKHGGSDPRLCLALLNDVTKGASASAAARKEFGMAGGCETVADCLRTHASDEGIARAALDATATLARDDPANATALCAAGVLNMIHDAGAVRFGGRLKRVAMHAMHQVRGGGLPSTTPPRPAPLTPPPPPPHRSSTPVPPHWRSSSRASRGRFWCAALRAWPAAREAEGGGARPSWPCRRGRAGRRRGGGSVLSSSQEQLYNCSWPVRVRTRFKPGGCLDSGHVCR